MVSAIDADKPFAQAIEQWVKKYNGGMYALVLHAADPQAAIALAHARGVATQLRAGPEAHVFGTRFLFQ